MITLNVQKGHKNMIKRGFMKKTSSVTSAFLILAAIILMILPIGVKQTWADPGGTYTYFYPYFSFFVFGASGNALPLLAAIFTSIAFFVMVSCIFWPSKTGRRYRITSGCLIITVVFSVLSFLVFNTTSIVGIIITVLIILPLLLQYFSNKE